MLGRVNEEGRSEWDRGWMGCRGRGFLGVLLTFPTPVSRHIIASLMYGMSILLARKPGESAETEATLPMRSQNLMAVASVSGEVCRPEMISTPFWMGTGFMKWVDTTLLEVDVSVGLEVVAAAAILVMEMEEVFVARIQCFGHISANCLKIDSFKEGISGTASMTMSTSERLDISEEGVMRAFMASESDWERRSFWTSLERSLSAKAMPLSSEAWELSTRVTGTEALRAATRAMPRPWKY